MSKIEIIKLPDPRFYVYSLDDFIRHQAVSECWRNIDGEWKLLPIAFTEDWGPEKRREEAAGIPIFISSVFYAVNEIFVILHPFCQRSGWPEAGR